MAPRKMAMTVGRGAAGGVDVFGADEERYAFYTDRITYNDTPHILRYTCITVLHVGGIMDAMVSARVPVEIKKRGDSTLKAIGSSATELINAAYKYVIEHEELPTGVAQKRTDEPRIKTLSGDAAKRFADRWGKCAVLEAQEYDGSNFKELLNQAREERYARLT